MRQTLNYAGPSDARIARHWAPPRVTAPLLSALLSPAPAVTAAILTSHLIHTPTCAVSTIISLTSLTSLRAITTAAGTGGGRGVPGTAWRASMRIAGSTACTAGSARRSSKSTKCSSALRVAHTFIPADWHASASDDGTTSPILTMSEVWYRLSSECVDVRRR